MKNRSYKLFRNMKNSSSFSSTRKFQNRNLHQEYFLRKIKKSDLSENINKFFHQKNPLFSFFPSQSSSSLAFRETQSSQDILENMLYPEEQTKRTFNSPSFIDKIPENAFDNAYNTLLIPESENYSLLLEDSGSDSGYETDEETSSDSEEEEEEEEERKKKFNKKKLFPIPEGTETEEKGENGIKKTEKTDPASDSEILKKKNNSTSTLVLKRFEKKFGRGKDDPSSDPNPESGPEFEADIEDWIVIDKNR